VHSGLFLYVSHCLLTFQSLPRTSRVLTNFPLSSPCIYSDILCCIFHCLYRSPLAQLVTQGFRLAPFSLSQAHRPFRDPTPSPPPLQLAGGFMDGGRQGHLALLRTGRPSLPALFTTAILSHSSLLLVWALCDFAGQHAGPSRLHLASVGRSLHHCPHRAPGVGGAIFSRRPRQPHAWHAATIFLRARGCDALVPGARAGGLLYDRRLSLFALAAGGCLHSS
jgi:hypothetical protein